MGEDGWVVGIDLGGTRLRTAAVDVAGAVLDLAVEPVDWVDHEGRPPFAQVLEAVDGIAARRGSAPAAIGVGATGPVRRATGTVENPHTLPAAMQGPIVDVLARRHAVPVALENDADALALGEWWAGAARGAERVVAITAGTGVGVGVVAGGAVVRGARGAHPEPGHMVVDPAGPECYCGARGCLESLASGTAIAAAARRRGAIGPDDDAAEVARRAAAGDPACQEVLAAARAALVTGAWNLAAAHAPDVLLLAGSALADPEGARADVERALHTFAFREPGLPEVRLAALGDAAGCLGAARAVIAA